MPEGRGRVRTTLEIDSKGKEELAQVKNGLNGLKGGAQGMIGALGSAGPVAAAVAAGLGVLTTALATAQRVAEAAVHTFVQLGLRGGSVDAIADRFERLAAPGTLARLQQLSGWQLRQTAIMDSWSTVMEVGLVSADEYEEWLTRVTRLAQDRGRDPSQVIVQMTAALRGGGIEALGEYGINVQEINDALVAEHQTMSTVAGKSMALDLALAQLREQQGDVSNSASNLADTWGALTNQWEDWQDDVSRTLSTSPALVSAFEEIREGLFGMGGTAQQSGVLIALLAQQIGGFLLTGISGAAQVAQFLIRMQRQMIEAWQSNPAARIGLRLLGRVLGIDTETSAGGLEAMEGMIGQIATTAQAARSALMSNALLAPAGAESGTGEARARGGGGRAASGGAHEAISLEQMITELRATELDQERDLLELMGGRGTEEEAFNAVLETQLELEDDLISRERERAEQAWDLAESMREAQAAVDEMAQKAHERLMNNFELAAGFVSEMGAIFGAIADAEERAGRSGDAWRKAQGVAMGIMYAIKAGAEFAQATADIASQNYLAGAGHIAAGVQFGVQSGLSFSQLAQSGGGGLAAPQKSSGSYVPAESSRVSSGGERSQGGNTYNYFSWGRSPAEFGRIVAEAPWQAEQAGLRASTPTGLRYE